MTQGVTVIGLTGSIGMGKSTVARQFAQCGAAMCDSDRLVHQLMAKGGKAVDEVAKLFPTTLKAHAIDRKALGAIVFSDKEKLKRLEEVLHPLVRREQEIFIRRAALQGYRVCVLDIPLLFETNGQERCDVTVVASAPFFVQRQRVFRRAGMTEEKFQRILALQLPDSAKRQRADFIVPTGLGLYASLRQVRKIMMRLTRETDKAE